MTQDVPQLSALQDDISAPPEAALELTVNEDDVELEIDSNEPSDVVLKYPPYAEELYSEQDDLVENEGTEVAEELKPLCVVHIYIPSQNDSSHGC